VTLRWVDYEEDTELEKNRIKCGRCDESLKPESQLPSEATAEIVTKTGTYLYVHEGCMIRGDEIA
jgi:hypothetical protein